MSTLDFKVVDVEPIWNSFHKAMPEFSPVHGAAHYNNLVEKLNLLIDAVGDDESHPMALLLQLTGKLIEDYESQHLSIPEGNPIESLNFLMDSNGLKQSDLANEIGGQSVVSEILNGHREINIRQAKALADKFGVSALVFID